MKIIDLRSDTLTKPTKAMLEAMMDARVGDDVFEEEKEDTEDEFAIPEGIEIGDLLDLMFGEPAEIGGNADRVEKRRAGAFGHSCHRLVAGRAVRMAKR